MSKKISVVIPVYNEVEALPDLISQLRAALAENDQWEIVFVDDGSTDGSSELLEKLARDDENVTVVQLYRNYGKSAALAEGFKRVDGDYVITMDADLQDDPAEIPNLIARIEEGYDLVSGWKVDRKDPWTKTIPSKIFNFVTRLLTGVKIHDFNCGLKIYRNEVVKSLDIYGGRHRYIPALAGQNKFKVSEIKVNHRPRIYGKTKYGGARLFHGFFDLLTILFLNRYTQNPLHLFGYFGLICLLVAVAAESYVVYLKVFLGHPFKIHFAMMLFGTMVFVLGLWFFSVGLIAEMIVRTQQGNEHRVKRVIQ